MEASNTINNYEYEMDQMRRRIGQLEAKANEAREFEEQIYQYEARLREMGTKIQSLQRDQEMAENIGQENESLKRKVK